MFEPSAKQTLTPDLPPRLQKRRRLSLLVLLMSALGMTFAALFVSSTSALSENHSSVEANNSPFLFTQDAGHDFSKFTHRNAAHTRLPCLLCHRREVNLTQPKRPGHTPCAGCHAEQFANPSSPICTICHASPAAPKPDVKAFPKLASFTMKFDHSRHKNTDCATCHKPTGKNNVALSIPSGFNAHTVCYQCHTAKGQVNGRDISSCGTCHQAGNFSRLPIFTKAFQVNFSHAKHGKTQQLDCSDCHQVKAGQGQRKQVSAPLPANHSAPEHALSCMSCHNGKRAFGGDDFKSCQRCHTGQTFRFQ